MLFVAIMLTAVYAAIVSAMLGWIVGNRIGDERGVIGYTLGGLALAAGVFYGIAA